MKKSKLIKSGKSHTKKTKQFSKQNEIITYKREKGKCEINGNGKDVKRIILFDLISHKLLPVFYKVVIIHVLFEPKVDILLIWKWINMLFNV